MSNKNKFVRFVALLLVFAMLIVMVQGIILPLFK